MCQDERVFNAMRRADTPCPFDGLIGDDAKQAWLANPERMPEDAIDKEELEKEKKEKEKAEAKAERDRQKAEERLAREAKKK